MSVKMNTQGKPPVDTQVVSSSSQPPKPIYRSAPQADTLKSYQKIDQHGLGSCLSRICNGLLTCISSIFKAICSCCCSTEEKTSASKLKEFAKQHKNGLQQRLDDQKQKLAEIDDLFNLSLQESKRKETEQRELEKREVERLELEKQEAERQLEIKRLEAEQLEREREIERQNLERQQTLEKAEKEKALPKHTVTIASNDGSKVAYNLTETEYQLLLPQRTEGRQQYIEETQQIREEVTKREKRSWEGKRIYPSGMIEEGIFDSKTSKLEKGKRWQEGVLTYVNISHQSGWDFGHCSSSEDSYSFYFILGEHGQRHLEFTTASKCDGDDIDTPCSEEPAEVLVKIFQRKKNSSDSGIPTEKQVRQIFGFPTYSQAQLERFEKEALEEELRDQSLSKLGIETKSFVGKRRWEKDQDFVLKGCLDFEAFLKEITPSLIFTLNSNVVLCMLKMAQEKRIPFDVQMQDPKTQKNLFELWVDRGESDFSLRELLEICPTAAKSEQIENLCLETLLCAEGRYHVEPFLEILRKQNTLSLRAELLLAAYEGKADMEIETICTGINEEFLKLSKELHFVANVYGNAALVRKIKAFGKTDLNQDLGMKKGPGIIGWNMDADQAYTATLGFFEDLQEKGLIFSAEGFSYNGLCYMGSDIGRILGGNYIEKTAQDLGLKHIKVPKQMVIFDASSEKISIKICTTGEIGLSNFNGSVYGEAVEKSDRKISYEEAEELVLLLEAVGFTAMNSEKIVVAEDGIYITDTDFENFWRNKRYFYNGYHYTEMLRICSKWLEKEDCQKLRLLLNEKIELFKKNQEKQIFERVAPKKMFVERGQMEFTISGEEILCQSK
jgi:hypothetical protein